MWFFVDVFIRYTVLFISNISDNTLFFIFFLIPHYYFFFFLKT